MEVLKQTIENHHRKVRENSFVLWKKIKDQPKGLYLLKSANLDEFNKRIRASTDFITPEYITLDKLTDMHPSIREFTEQYLPSEGFIYVIAIDTLPADYPHKSILSPQLVYKHADRD